MLCTVNSRIPLITQKWRCHCHSKVNGLMERQNRAGKDWTQYKVSPSTKMEEQSMLGNGMTPGRNINGWRWRQLTWRGNHKWSEKVAECCPFTNGALIKFKWSSCFQKGDSRSFTYMRFWTQAFTRLFSTSASAAIFAIWLKPSM